MSRSPAGGLFLLFCLLLALRDTFTQILLTGSATNGGARAQVAPVSMLFVYCWTAVALAWFFRFVRTGAMLPRVRMDRRQAARFVKLGIATWGVYAATIWGIGMVGAPVFNIVDYGAMPIMTMAAATLLVRERLSLRSYGCGLLGVIGVVLLLTVEPATSRELGGVTASWTLGVVLALLSPILTAYSSALQKQQVAEGLHPDEVLLYRFPIPALLMTTWFIATQPMLTWSQTAALVLVGAAGLFLPLLLLCFGFMRASLGQFASYLFLIPVFTLVMVPAVVVGEWERLMHWQIAVGSLLLLGSYVTAEVLPRATSTRREQTGADGSRR
ncbi:MAG TPA: DMT family transporter [Planctomycetota bacterium]|nr:DMT family transporter [Planctomycetota bacterium]